MKPNSPPKWPYRFLCWFCKPELLEYIEGDLLETFEDNLERYSFRKARRKYSREVLGLFRPGIVRKINLTSIHPIPTAMFFNYLKVGFRQIRRHVLFSALNIIGLAVSMAICLLLMMVLVDQYDQDTFHSNREQIVRIVTGSAPAHEALENIQTFLATGPLPIARELKESLSGVKEAVRVKKLHGAELLSDDKNLSAEGFYVDQSFLEVFDFGDIQGDEQRALSAPYSLVLTQETAQKLYGNIDPVGKILKVGNGTYDEFQITGVMENPPKRTHMPFEFLLSFSTYETQNPEETQDWGNCWDQWIYLLLGEGETAKGELAASLEKISLRQSERNQNLSFRFQAQPLPEINPAGNHMVGNEIALTTPHFVFFILSILGFVIIISACINYTNLSIARSLRRAKEIGIRKVIGGKRIQLITQFLVESVLISLLALLLAIILLEFLIPAFYNLDRNIPLLFNLERTPQLYLLFLGFSVLVGLIAGIFPALHLSKYQPIEVLKSLKRLKAFSFLGLRKGLIILQFVFCLIFVLSSILLLKQHNLSLSIDHGFAHKNIIQVDLQNQAYEIFSQKASQIGAFEQVSGCYYKMASGNSGGITLKIPNSPDRLNLHSNYVTRNFFDNMQMKFIAGGSFPENISGSTDRYVVLNETGVEKLRLGSPNEAIGKALEHPIDEDSTRLLTVVGVVSDFYDMGVAQPVSPYCFRFDLERIRHANVRVKSILSPFAIKQLKSVWKEVDPIRTLKFTYSDREVEERYGLMGVMSKVVGTVSMLAIIIACMGLLGMVAYMVEGRVKEVGIRKILGASTKELVWTLSKSFVLLLGIATLVAIPLAIYLNKMWIETQQFQVAISPQVILLGIGIVLLLSIIVVSSQTFSAAQGDPVKALRSE